MSLRLCDVLHQPVSLVPMRECPIKTYRYTYIQILLEAKKMNKESSLSKLYDALRTTPSKDNDSNNDNNEGKTENM